MQKASFWKQKKHFTLTKINKIHIVFYTEDG